MANLTTVGLTAGAGSSGTGTVSTLDNVIGTAGTPSANVQTVQGVTSMTPLKVDGSGVTQPVSVASLPSQAVTNAGTFAVQVTSAPTTAVTLATAPTTPVTGTFWQATQPVSLATAPTTPVTGTFFQATQPVSATALPLPTGAATSANQPTAAAIASTTSGQTGHLALGATTTAAPTYTTAQTNPLSLDTAGNLRVNVVTGGTSGTVTQGSTTSGQSGNLVQGAVTTSSPTYTTAQTSPLSLDTTGALRVNVTAGGAGGGIVTQSSGANLKMQLNDGTTSIPVLAASSGAPAATVPALPVSIRDVNPNGSAVSASSAPVVIASDQSTLTTQLASSANLVSGAITTAMTGTTSTSLVAAPGASLRNYITTIIVSNSHATVGTDVIIQDGSGGTTLLTIPAAAAYGGATVTLPVPLRQPTTNTALFCANVTTGSSTKVSAVGYKAA